MREIEIKTACQKIGCRHQCNTHAHHESRRGRTAPRATRRAAPSGAAVEGRPGARGGWPRERRYQHRKVVSRPVSRETRVPTAATRRRATPELCVRHPRRSGLSRFTDGPAGGPRVFSTFHQRSRQGSQASVLHVMKPETTSPLHRPTRATVLGGCGIWRRTGNSRRARARRPS